MIVCAGVGAAHDHDGGITLEQTEIANWRLQQMAVVFEPGRSEAAMWSGPFGQVDGTRQHVVLMSLLGNGRGCDR